MPVHRRHDCRRLTGRTRMQTPIDANELEPARMFYGWQVVYTLAVYFVFKGKVSIEE